MKEKEKEETITDLLQKGPSEKLSNALKDRYGEKDGREMARQYRINYPKIKDEVALKKAAGIKARQREEAEYAREGKSVRGSGSLNVKGKQVSNLTKGGGEFEAGEGRRWHVHYDHVKWGTSGGTRINFAGRTRADILSAFLGLQPAAGNVNRPSWDACNKWMQANL